MARWLSILIVAGIALLMLAADTPQLALDRAWYPFVIGSVLLGVMTFGIWIATLRMAIRRATTAMQVTRVRDSQAEARYCNLFESAGDAVWETDAQGRIVAINPAGERLFAVGVGEAIGHQVADFLTPGDWGRVRPSGVRRASEPFEVSIAPKGREAVTIEVSARALPDGRVQAIARDITERKRLLDRAAHSQRLEALGRLAGGVAHDFNNVLTVITGSAEMLKVRVSEGQAADLVTQILDASARATRLTRQLLTFGRGGYTAPVPTDLTAAVAGCADLLRGLMADRAPLELRLAANLPVILADPTLLEQILLNLVVNARDASHNGEPVVVTTGPADHDGARLTVADRGVGMDSATQARVFEPFFTTKSMSEGTGLGLATVYGAVHSLGAQIRFSSAPGVGTTFEVDFRPATANPTPTPYPTPPHPDADTPRTVLLVEDDDAVRDVARFALEQGGYRLIVADCGPQALELAAAHDGPIDLVLTDVMMPHYSGRELADRLTALRPGMRIMYISGYTGTELSQPARNSRREFFLPKPLTASELVARVRDVIG